MKLKLREHNVIPMKELKDGEFGVLAESYGSEPAGTVVWSVFSEERYFAVVGSRTLNKFYKHSTGLVIRLKAGDVLEID